jgi:hypothetical protein
MRNQEMFSKFFTYMSICLVLFTTDIHATDMELLQQQCAEIGFKVKTPDNGKCVLKLLKKINIATDTKSNSDSQSQSIEAAEQRTYERQQNYAQDADRLQRERMQQQQQEMLELQRRSVVAQENAAQAQRAANYQNIIQSFTPRAPLNCTSMGNFTTCR